MTPLERRCRRLLWLLPPDDRATRGEELVGLLCDVSGERARPRPVEVLAFSWLALRLRFRATRTGLVLLGTALLLAFATAPLGNLVDIYTGAVPVRDLEMLDEVLNAYLAIVVVPVVAAVAWLFGMVRTALAAHGVVVAYLVVTYAVLGQRSVGEWFAIGVYLLPPVLVLVMLAAAWRQGWAPPRPPGVWLALLLLCVLAWKGLGAWSREAVQVHNAVLVAAVVGAAVAGVVLVRRHRWQAMTLAAVVGAAAGFALFVLVLVAGVSEDRTLPMALAVFAVGAPAHLVAERRRPTRSGSFAPAHGGPSAVPGGR